MANFSALYAAGNGVDKSYLEAMQWARKGADAGSADAMNRVGLLFVSNQGGAPNYIEASNGTASALTKATSTPCTTLPACMRMAGALPGTMPDPVLVQEGV